MQDVCCSACNVIYINSTDVESLTGTVAVTKAIERTFANSKNLPKTTVVHFKVTSQGITLTDNKRRSVLSVYWQLFLCKKLQVICESIDIELIYLWKNFAIATYAVVHERILGTAQRNNKCRLNGGSVSVAQLKSVNVIVQPKWLAHILSTTELWHFALDHTQATRHNTAIYPTTWVLQQGRRGPKFVYKWNLGGGGNFKMLCGNFYRWGVKCNFFALNG